MLVESVNITKIEMFGS